MNLWIRSQDKRNLINCARIWMEGGGITHKETYYICGSTHDYDNSWILGEYSSKQRALEVLDIIQYKLKAKSEVFQMPEE